MVYSTLLLTVGALLLCAVAHCHAAEWPQETWLGPPPRFHVVDITPGGSGRAAGIVVDVPGFQPFAIVLSRIGSGEITGTGKTTILAHGLKLYLDYKITDKGLEGKGTVSSSAESSAGPIKQSVINVLPHGAVRGTGRIEVGNLIMPCKLRTSGSTLKIEGSLRLDPVKKETPLASYTFVGKLVLGLAGEDPSERTITINAIGSVDRYGKLTGIVDSYGPFDEAVDPTNGEVTLNVAGAQVVFDLW